MPVIETNELEEFQRILSSTLENVLEIKLRYGWNHPTDKDVIATNLKESLYNLEYLEREIKNKLEAKSN